MCNGRALGRIPYPLRVNTSGHKDLSENLLEITTAGTKHSNDFIRHKSIVMDVEPFIRRRRVELHETFPRQNSVKYSEQMPLPNNCNTCICFKIL